MTTCVETEATAFQNSICVAWGYTPVNTHTEG